MRTSIALACGLLIGAAAAPGPAATRDVRVSVLAVSLNGEPLDQASGPGPLAVRERFIPRLLAQGFSVVPDSDPAALIGGDYLLQAGLGKLHIELGEPDFTFNVVLLPPRWSKTKTGAIELRELRSGAVLWSKTIKVPLSIPKGPERIAATVDKLARSVGEIRPVRRASNHLFLGSLVELNRPGLTPAEFSRAARPLALAPVASGAALVEVAMDPRLGADPELQAELLNRAVLSEGAAVAPALDAALSRLLETGARSGEPMALLLEAFERIGADPGDRLLPFLASRPLAELLEARRSFRFTTRRDALERLVEGRVLAALDATGSFADAERLLGTLPLGELSLATLLGLRDRLYARLETGRLAEQQARLVALFPSLPAEDMDFLDEPWLAGARGLAGRPETERLAHYMDYLACSPRGAAAERLSRLLELGPRLEAELASRLARSRHPGAEQEALRDLYGPTPGPEAFLALGRAVLAALGPAPSDEALLDLAARHPDLARVQGLLRRRGLERDAAAHVFPVSLGATEAEIRASLGPGAERRAGITRRELSPAAIVSAESGVPGSGERGLVAIEYPGRALLLLHEGRAFRVLIHDSRGRFHHGVRTGDTEQEAAAALGQPDESRSLLFGRLLLTWKGLHGGRTSLHAAIDKGRVSFLYEEDGTAASQALAALRDKQ